ncbi:MAG: purine-nucleoside phosphorylase [Anaerolineae bacterium]|nr:purine-nucleoside phosphorylase [Anaerolineae bacterium]
MNDAPDLSETIQTAAAYVRTRDPRPWRVLLILGSGLGGLADKVQNPTRISYADIPGFARSTVAGHSGQFVIGDLFGVPVAVMQGRVHFYEGHPLWQVGLPVRVAKAMGVETMIVTNAAGGIHRDFQVADLMLMTDHISLAGLAGHNPLMGPNDERLGLRFPAVTGAYDAQLQRFAVDAAREANVDLKQGVYVCVSGPMFETPAELRFLRIIGADAVGMSTAHEVVVARHAGIRVLGFSGITNVARLSADEGEPPSHSEVMEAAPRIAPKLHAVIEGTLRRMHGAR